MNARALSTLFLFVAACTDTPANAPASQPVKATASADVPAYVAKGDLAEIKKRGSLRFLVRDPGERLQREGDPSLAEQQLAKRFATKLGVQAVFVEASDLEEMMKALEEGRGDVIAASLAITPERSARAAFSRPVRTVKQQVVVKADDATLTKLEDLDGKEVTVRASSSYAASLKKAQEKLKGLKIKDAPESDDTYALIQQVARGEAKITVADNDILEDAMSFEKGVKAAFTLTEKDPIAWAMRKDNPELKQSLDGFLIENALTAFKDKAYKADLDDIQKKDVLRVLTRNSSTSYFVYRGEQLGFEYELMQNLTKELGVRLEVVIPPSREALAQYLAEGKGDIVAAGITITDERKKDYEFSAPYNTISELLIVPASDTTTKGLGDLKGAKIAVRKSSSYYASLEKLKAQHGFEIQAVDEAMETEEILDGVAEGKFRATVADSNIVEVELTYAQRVRSAGPIGEPRQVGWMIRKDQPKLKAALDAHIKKTYKGMFYNMTVNKYFKNSKQMKTAASANNQDLKGAISAYDELAKKYAKQYEFDWRLVLAQMYQESHFDPAAKSWVGALGLMQVMPKTAKDLKIEDVVDPEQGIHAGVKLMHRYAKMFTSPDVKEKDRLRFALASYNCGPGHVIDARRIAIDLKLNPNKWFGNVEQAMLLLSKPEHAKKARHGYCRCEEPVNYVSQIQSRYDSYSKLVALQ
ncbi:MAG: transporter substrate-binding domain-containing protein [Deltaproteobacteria bacterium]|nr:transporter substrate-binding domain-containing protein [Deltaproteobacteria bacterium]